MLQPSVGFFVVASGLKFLQCLQPLHLVDPCWSKAAMNLCSSYKSAKIVNTANQCKSPVSACFVGRPFWISAGTDSNILAMPMRTRSSNATWQILRVQGRWGGCAQSLWGRWCICLTNRPSEALFCGNSRKGTTARENLCHAYLSYIRTKRCNKNIKIWLPVVVS